MSDPRTVDREAAAEANRRYWDTEASVNHIAEELGLSKSSLYGLIEQLETGLACPDCQTELVFPNRTARDRGMVSCPACPFEAQSDEVLESVDGEVAVTERTFSSLTTGANGRVLAGTALLGVAAGLLLGSVLRRR